MEIISSVDDIKSGGTDEHNRHFFIFPIYSNLNVKK